MRAEDATAVPRSSLRKAEGWYPYYVLGAFVLVNAFNFVDRQLLSILAEDVKTDLKITDAQLGFLLGTAFAIFYATFGLVLGRVADLWNRKRIVALGVCFWSAMTTLSGLATSFNHL